MPDLRLDAITSAIGNLETDWTALVAAAKAASDPRTCVDLLDAGLVDLQAQVIAIHGDMLRLPTKDIAIDLNTPAS